GQAWRTDPYAELVRASGPSSWFRLGEKVGNRINDEIAGNYGIWSEDLSNVTVAAAITSPNGAVKLPAVPARSTAIIPSQAVPTISPISIEFWFAADKPPKDTVNGWAYILWEGGVGVRVMSTLTPAIAGTVEFILTD